MWFRFKLNHPIGSYCMKQFACGIRIIINSLINLHETTDSIAKDAIFKNFSDHFPVCCLVATSSDNYIIIIKLFIYYWFIWRLFSWSMDWSTKEREKNCLISVNNSFLFLQTILEDGNRTDPQRQFLSHWCLFRCSCFWLVWFLFK